MAGYSRLQILLHWLVAVLIGLAWLTHEGMEREGDEALRAARDGTPLHVWLGLAVFALVLVRIAVRLWRGPVPPLPGTPRLMALAGEWMHRVLYVLMVLAPALGMLTWFGGLRFLGEVHESASNLLMIVALVHAGAALFHHYVLRDDTLRRMLRPGSASGDQPIS